MAVHTADKPYEAHRLTVDTGTGFDEFRDRYEQAVPALDMPVFEHLMAENADWPAVLRATEENAPHGFIIYWSFDNTALLRLSGDRWRSVQYLMGNHTIAQRMFHHNPTVMLYAPLRTTICEDADGVTRFSIDQPSAQFGGFDDPAITAVGVELDHKVADLLDYLGAPVPAQLTAA
ncbi:hypothetical protein Aph01nite_46290 [Acrocarpospora phusangensis]|uniref:DUF302 domain-containing protein n=1 Tax=Acrocarpospora phusangensis TaxID=1070424 RepID=A0A919QEJ3_9ACTN|nr:DUF302 domain-containing protein [Acrocarpospora phusangensis]GIH26319.1 hypothetical protein Aph01nite_46290 [Acrocarpospora phusangensis]